MKREDVTDKEISLREAKKIKWRAIKGEVCADNCWCRRIETVDGRCVLTEGWLSKTLAQYFVKLHNKQIQ